MGFLLKSTQGRSLPFTIRPTNSRSKKLLIHGQMSPLHLHQAQTSIITFLLDLTLTWWLTSSQFRLLNHLAYHPVLDPSISMLNLFLKEWVKPSPKLMAFSIWDYALQTIGTTRLYSYAPSWLSIVMPATVRSYWEGLCWRTSRSTSSMTSTHGNLTKNQKWQKFQPVNLLKRFLQQHAYSKFVPSLGLVTMIQTHGKMKTISLLTLAMYLNSSARNSWFFQHL